MSNAVYLPFDCESGGIGAEISLLTAHFAVCDQDFNVIDELALAVKPKEVDETGSTIYRVTAAALSINGINLIDHDKVAVTKEQAGQMLREFLWKYKPQKGFLIPVGKNIGGDVDWVNNHILGEKEWRKFVSYRTYDITTLVHLLKRVGKLPLEAPESLEGLARFKGHNFIAHTARGDNMAGIEVVKWLESLLYV